MNVIFIGPPGAGKGTQAQKLAAERKWPHLSSGDILRGEVKAGSPLGRKAAEYMEAGKLVPDELVVGMMVGRVLRQDCTAGFILDGFPRTDAQAVALDKALAEQGRPLDVVVYFECSDGEVLRRITGRLSCPACGAVFHRVTKPPRAADVCDLCGAALTQRKDDTAEVVGQRLATYRRQTAPLIDYYRSRSLLRQIDAEQPIDAICNQLAGVVDK